MSAETPLVERERAVDELVAALARSRGGGRVVLLEGPAGIGKSRLMEVARDRAAGFEVLWARGGALEQDIAFGVVRQLLERRVARAPEAERAAAHRRAARLLHDEPEPAERIVPHLLASSPSGDDWAVRTLRQAGVEALGRGAPDVAVRVLRRALEEAAGAHPQLALLLEGELGHLAWVADVAHPVIAQLGRHRSLAGATQPERVVLALLALEALRDDEPAEAVRQLALRALGGGRLVAEGGVNSMPFYAATFALIEAEADERTCAERAVPTMVGIGASSLALALLEQGDVDAAHRTLEEHELLQDQRPLYVWGPDVRGLVRLAQGRAAEALADLEDVGRHTAEVGGATSGLPWRAHAALAHAALGDGEAARDAAGEELGAPGGAARRATSASPCARRG